MALMVVAGQATTRAGTTSPCTVWNESSVTLIDEPLPLFTSSFDRSSARIVLSPAVTVAAENVIAVPAGSLMFWTVRSAMGVVLSKLAAKGFGDGLLGAVRRFGHGVLEVLR